MKILDKAKTWQFVGSRVICVPAPTDTDCDIVALFASLNEVDQAVYEFNIKSSGRYKITASRDSVSDTCWASFRYNEYNMIATDCQKEYNAFIYACKISKAANLLNKDERVFIHSLFMQNKANTCIPDFTTYASGSLWK